MSELFYKRGGVHYSIDSRKHPTVCCVTLYLVDDEFTELKEWVNSRTWDETSAWKRKPETPELTPEQIEDKMMNGYYENGGLAEDIRKLIEKERNERT